MRREEENARAVSCKPSAMLLRALRGSKTRIPHERKNKPSRQKQSNNKNNSLTCESKESQPSQKMIQKHIQRKHRQLGDDRDCACLFVYRKEGCAALRARKGQPITCRKAICSGPELFQQSDALGNLIAI